MLTLCCTSRGLLDMFEIIKKPLDTNNTYQVPIIHTVRNGTYELTDANILFPEHLFDNILNPKIIYLNFIDATTGKVRGIVARKHEWNETIGETIFKAAEDFQALNNIGIGGILIRYNNGESRKNIQFLPFAVIE